MISAKKKKYIAADKHKRQIIDWLMVLTLNIYTCCEFMCNRSHRHTSRYANVDSWFYRVGHQGGMGHLSILTSLTFLQ